jgi:hypothetical protein
MATHTATPETSFERLKRLRNAKRENVKIDLSLSAGSHRLDLVAAVCFVHDKQDNTTASHGVTSLAIVERRKEIQQAICPEWLEDWIIENLTDADLIAKITLED